MVLGLLLKRMHKRIEERQTALSITVQVYTSKGIRNQSIKAFPLSSLLCFQNHLKRRIQALHKNTILLLPLIFLIGIAVFLGVSLDNCGYS